MKSEVFYIGVENRNGTGCCVTLGSTYPMTSVVTTISLCDYARCESIIEFSSRHTSLILHFIDLTHDFKVKQDASTSISFMNPVLIELF